MEFNITQGDKPTRGFQGAEKIPFPFDKLGAPAGNQCFGFDVPIGFKSQCSYQLNHVERKNGTVVKKVGLNKIQDEKQYQMTRGTQTGEAKNDSYFRVVRIK